MRIFFSAIIILLYICTNAQAPPIIQWQKCFGGSELDGATVLKTTDDGGYILGGYTTSNDGDISGHKDSSDVLIIKLSNTGNIEWQKCYGGSGNEGATDILPTSDGGYIILAYSSSLDGDVTGNHGSSDIWVLKINSAGALLWQRSYGSSADDHFLHSKICPSVSGGYIIMGIARKGDGDVSGYHPASLTSEDGDIWVFKIDLSGDIVWQKCLGGTKTEYPGTLIPTAAGEYLIAGNSSSSDGDITCGNGASGIFWMVMLNDTGILLWQKCQSASSTPIDGKQTSDGGFIFTGGIAVSGKVADLYVLKCDASGTKQWESNYGGSQYDLGNCIELTNDGGYVIAGLTSTSGEVICNFKGGYDIWLIKLNSSGKMEWQKTYGGSNPEEAWGICQTPDGGFIVAGVTQSVDGDVTNSIRRGFTDIWLLKLSFPGVEILPSINITASETKICPGKNITFTATCTDPGDMPSYQWRINGVNTGTGKDTFITNTLNNGDKVSCILTSNSPCVTTDTAESNSIVITVDPSLTPVNFLPADAAVCDYGTFFGTVDVRPVSSFKTYLWSNNASTSLITISQPGIYWLSVTTNKDCPGLDTIIVSTKDCPKGFFMPTAFTPNDDGKNDILKPIFGGNLKQFKLIIANRWGQVIFQTSDVTQGWNGKLKGVKQDNNVYVWTCTYQFEGEEIKFEKGTVAIIR